MIILQNNSFNSVKQIIKKYILETIDTEFEISVNGDVECDIIDEIVDNVVIKTAYLRDVLVNPISILQWLKVEGELF